MSNDNEFVDCSPRSLTHNTWNNMTQFWNGDPDQDVDKWPLVKVFKAMRAIAHHYVNSDKESPASMLFDSYMFDRMSVRWTSTEVGGCIRLVNKRASIDAKGVHDETFQKWFKQDEKRRRDHQAMQRARQVPNIIL